MRNNHILYKHNIKPNQHYKSKIKHIFLEIPFSIKHSEFSIKLVGVHLLGSFCSLTVRRNAGCVFEQFEALPGREGLEGVEGAPVGVETVSSLICCFWVRSWRMNFLASALFHREKRISVALRWLWWWWLGGKKIGNWVRVFSAIFLFKILAQFDM